MKQLYGNTSGLKADQIRRLERLYRRRIPTEYIITPEIAREMSLLSHEIRRQIGILADRKGNPEYVIIGDAQKIEIPDTSGSYRSSPGRLRGLRCIHTHLRDEPLSDDDIADLALLRLDMMAAITFDDNGLFHQLHAAHILPSASDGMPYQILAPLKGESLNIGCLALIQSLEDEMAQIRALFDADKGRERALLISVSTESKAKASDFMAELEELTISAGIRVVGTLLQQRKKADSRFLMGRGKLQEMIFAALQKGATLIIFDQELNASQMRSITERIDLKVLDRTQLILDIFAQRATSREGKLQVELAQLKYLLPRLVTKNTAMSRLTGGIGGRGPGETKLEINRRRARERIHHISEQLETVRKQRKHQKAKRNKRDIPVISIIGYTNAGKSTLLNTLTQSHVLAESRMFATLDPSGRRLRFPQETEVIITDTVGFIRDLPQDLITAFRATLEELENADLLLHVIDISNPRFEDQIESVERILADLELDEIPALRVLNKKDLLDDESSERLTKILGGIAISAKTKKTLLPLIEKMEAAVRPFFHNNGKPSDKSPGYKIKPAEAG